MNEKTLHTADARTTDVTIRRLAGEDLAAVTRLAQRDSAREPTGPLLGVESDGRLLAASSIASGEVIADPFVHTAEIVELLRLRARQAGGDPRRRSRWLLSLLRARPRRDRAATAPSPPGAGGWLLSTTQRTGC